MLTATVFDTRGVAFAAWTLAAFAIGAFLGMLIRRIVPAMAATLGAYLGLQLLTWLVLRKHYCPRWSQQPRHQQRPDHGPITPAAPRGC